ncbi:GPI mannosyltransferase 1 [Fasciola gigantica]|uniref:GPI alpha-1,4-mannosyltransferase I, catalytic subunit n=1 Tax=Fasciola gigantica TaxID=46835 RepID=A0A504YKY4_FASGI|nr:GPI mannosyltransferase 1 [Fasciola gigantica]
MDIDVNSVPTSEGDRSSLQHSISSQDESSLKIPKSFSFLAPSTRLGCCIVVGLLLRIILLAFSVWQDENRWPDGQLRFTDVDYDVFSDASRALIRGDNIYEARPTYRYSPLIAAIVAPGFMFSPTHTAKQPVDSETESFFYPPLIRLSPLTKSNQDPLLAKIWGKLVFIFADIVCAWLQFEVIRTESTVLFKHKTAGHTETTAVWLICLGWLFNPVTAVVSVRGNAEAVLGVCILGCLLLVIRKCALFAGVLFGLCVHLKLYPIIYAPSIYLWLLPFTKNHSPLSLKRRLWLLLPRWPHVWFGIGAITSLGGLTYLGYLYFGGYRFLHQAYFYHFTRVDIKHNFAPHFYPLYLLSGLEWRQSGLTESGTISDILPIGTARRLYSRLQNTISSLMYNSNEAQEPLSSVFHFTIQSILQDAFQLRLMKLAFSLASVLPSIILICFLAFRLRLKPGLCWFTTTFAFVTFNKVSVK